MTTIRLYDDTIILIDRLAEKYDTTEAEVVDMILTQLDEEELDSMLK